VSKSVAPPPSIDDSNPELTRRATGSRTQTAKAKPARPRSGREGEVAPRPLSSAARQAQRLSPPAFPPAPAPARPKPTLPNSAARAIAVSSFEQAFDAALAALQQTPAPPIESRPAGAALARPGSFQDLAAVAGNRRGLVDRRGHQAVASTERERSSASVLSIKASNLARLLVRLKVLRVATRG